MEYFDFNEAFSRNLGWVNDLEQLALRDKTVAIAGLGGVGGFHLLTCCRLGIQNFKISDPDQFELVNFNRQVGATISSIGKSKSDVLFKLAKEINPNVNIEIFDEINAANIDNFLKEADLYLDGMDFFAVETRELIFNTAEKMKITAITAAPIGMGASCIIFSPDGMSFREYFQWKENPRIDKIVNFIIGLTPNAYHLKYLVDKSKVDLANQKGPSTIMACMLSSGIAVVEALKVLLNRGKVLPAPYYHQFDAYRGKHKIGRLYFGIQGPIQQLKKMVVKRILNQTTKNTHQNDVQNSTLIKKIISLAKWAPSGDNSQPWRFELVTDTEFNVIIKNSLENDFYDFDGRPTVISAGCLIESILLAAKKFRYSAVWESEKHVVPLKVNIKLIEGEPEDTDNLEDFLIHRSVNRFSYLRKSLSEATLNKIKTNQFDDYEISFITEKSQMRQMIKINMLATQIRLLIEQTHRTHSEVIKYDDNPSAGIPIKTVGLSWFTTQIMKLFLNNWHALYFINNFLGGAYIASIELDYVPGQNSSGFIVVNAKKPIDFMNYDELILTGMQIQRIWLYLTKLNLVMQPSYTPILISYYIRNHVEITKNKRIIKKIEKLIRLFSTVGLSERTVFIGRLGYAKHQSQIRSQRLSTESLILNNDNCSD
ncbi:ThiF family adenylyltransferase [Legionella waltersii]|uniref:Thiazole biosynthesis adenylyltransferase ThiF n=1 Tax=Legionella waltersii TaxID=66969 RepID=A0A0W1A4Y3_9GAMM|nr:ThiF family adenylyltransferase [Legionella waltersii]KTD76312.1 thiazole biosynthesis adenylyltransferase ThiF [Legionella waltersii]SNV13633.1 thiazole biosynthesis adenylyltransferase ThiF [Legionella waltersii]